MARLLVDLENGVGALCPLTVDRALEDGGLMRRAAGRTCATPTGVCGPGSNQLNPQIVCRKRGCPVSPPSIPNQFAHRYDAPALENPDRCGGWVRQHGLRRR